MRSLILALLLVCPASASDVWVDAINGDDANGGTAAADAWRTVTHALIQLGATPGPDVDVVHVLPGQYTHAGGEAFPLALRDKLRLEGEGDRESILFRGQINIGVGQDPTGWETGLCNLTLEDPGTGIELRSPNGGGGVRQATIRSVVFRNKTLGIYGKVSDPASEPGGYRIEDCLFDGCYLATSFSSKGGGHLRVTMKDTLVLYSTGPVGSLRASSGVGGTTELELERVQLFIGQQASYGLTARASVNASISLRMLDCVVVASPSLSTYGVLAEGPLHLERCTLAGHTIALHILSASDVVVRDCVFGDNNNDWLSLPGVQLRVENTITLKPGFAGINGNIGAEPNFVDPLSGNYRLAHGSAGIDQLPALELLDPDGVPRNQDGDLDGLGLRDMGAYETRTLFGPTTAAPGAPLVFELQGFAGELARLYLSRVPSAFALPSPYGSAWLSPGTLIHVQDATTGGANLTQVHTTAPDHPSLVGTTFGYQALLRSPASAGGAAWSTPVFLTLE